MNQILEKKIISEGVKDITISSQHIARKRKAGQFIILRIDEYGERIPMTIVDSDPKAGTIRLIFQEVGKSTYSLGDLEVGDEILDLVGPLGKPTHIENFGTVVCVGGGIGVAPVYPIAAAMKEAGNEVISIIGSRDKDLLIMEQEMSEVSDRLLITTDDGSYGLHGFVTNALQNLIDEGVKIDLCVAIGPVVMMGAVSNLTKEFGIETVVSLNSIMVDGTGMCGCCRVTVGNKTQFVCVDGPEFDGHQVDFKELMMRQSAYLPQEKEAMDRYHKCKLERLAAQPGGK
ncbi:MAG: sulfide/dihydroorotate dehydrogenase-like FAD/NAD-binding protein [Candidatus Hatepunaea meridiana]|nr:sulfide/dihydroorotate dehydrogenase-like FAD/NAD-binding protein [Candidatus Hatepunaea meridiana]